MEVARQQKGAGEARERLPRRTAASGGLAVPGQRPEAQPRHAAEVLPIPGEEPGELRFHRPELGPQAYDLVSRGPDVRAGMPGVAGGSSYPPTPAAAP